MAAIEKIIRTTKKFILVCAQSNAACDEIAQRLSKTLTKEQMLRMYSKSFDLDKLSATLRPYCNLVATCHGDEFQYPCFEDLYRYRVLVCTLSTAGYLVKDTKCFKSNHFGWIFIDECASAHETMSLIPIAGIPDNIQFPSTLTSF